MATSNPSIQLDGDTLPELRTAPAGRPWYCWRHKRAGLSLEPQCCRSALAVVTARDQALWYADRIARKPADVRSYIATSRWNGRGGIFRISEHAQSLGKLWYWAPAVSPI